MIKKFKNGKILLKPDSIEDIKSESFYHDEMFFKDLYIETDSYNGSSYIIDYHNDKAYYLGSNYLQNPLKWILDQLELNGKMYLYPLSKNESVEIIKSINEDDYQFR